MGQEGYTFLGIIKLGNIKESEVKDRLINKYKRRLRLILRSKLNGENKVTAMNTWAVATFRYEYGAGNLSWRVHKLNSIDRRTRKIMAKHRAFHPKSDVDILYLTRSQGGRGMTSIQHCVRGEENSLGLHVKNSAEKLIERVRMAGTIEAEGTINRSDVKQQKLQELKQT